MVVAVVPFAEGPSGGACEKAVCVGVMEAVLLPFAPGLVQSQDPC